MRPAPSVCRSAARRPLEAPSRLATGSASPRAIARPRGASPPGVRPLAGRALAASGEMLAGRGAERAGEGAAERASDLERRHGEPDGRPAASETAPAPHASLFRPPAAGRGCRRGNEREGGGEEARGGAGGGGEETRGEEARGGAGGGEARGSSALASEKGVEVPVASVGAATGRPVEAAFSSSSPPPSSLRVPPPSSSPSSLLAPPLPPPPSSFAPPFFLPPYLSSLSVQSSLASRPRDASVPPPCSPGPSLVVFSGGTGVNSLAGALSRLTLATTHVLPVTDDGGSTAEVVRVLGGPSVGDIRSRCLRLAAGGDPETRAVCRLLAHRLPAGDAAAARLEWDAVVEGHHPLWRAVSDPYKHVVRSFFVHFYSAVLRHAHERFDYRAGSLGNFFFAGARVFFRSLEAAIFLFSRVAGIPPETKVLPAVAATETTLSLGAQLQDGTVILGQNQISHPPASPSATQSRAGRDGREDPRAAPAGAPPAPDSTGEAALAAPAGASPTPGFNGGAALAAPADAPPAFASARPPSQVDKAAPQAPLPSPISRVFYAAARDPRDGGGQPELAPRPHPRVLAEIAAADAILYGCGSLYTSLAPSLVLPGVGEEIARRVLGQAGEGRDAQDGEEACAPDPAPGGGGEEPQGGGMAPHHLRKPSSSQSVHEEASFAHHLANAREPVGRAGSPAFAPPAATEEPIGRAGSPAFASSAATEEPVGQPFSPAFAPPAAAEEPSASASPRVPPPPWAPSASASSPPPPPLLGARPSLSPPPPPFSGASPAPAPAPPRILLLNGSIDRETSRSLRSASGPMKASDFVWAVADALNRRGARAGARGPLDHPPSVYVSHLVAPRGGSVELDREALRALGVDVREVDSTPLRGRGAGGAAFAPAALVDAIADILAGG